MRIAIGIPHTAKGFSGKFLDSIVGLTRPDEGLHIIRVSDLPVDEARNAMAEKFLSHPDAEYLLMVDSDMVFHPRSLERLVSRLDRAGANRLGQQVDMVGALAFTRCMPPVPTVFRDVAGVENSQERLYIQMDETLSWLKKHPAAQECPTVLPGIPLDAMVPADATGCAFILYSRYVFEHIQPPWFVRDGLKRGEDFHFFQTARHRGFRLWIDRSVVVGHEHGDSFIGPKDFMAFRKLAPKQAVS
jgi:hypothetical protein